MPSMQERYTTELREREASTIDVLFLDNSEGGQIGGIDDSLVNLVSLSMVNCGLKSFKGLPSLPALQHIDVSNNEIGEDAQLDIVVKNCPEVERFMASSNKFTSLEQLRPLKMLAKLTELDISANEELGLTESYREKVFEMIPSLKVLDGCDANGDEVEEEFVGEGGEDSGEEDSGDEEDGPGLSYLDKSQFSDDETEDYQPKEGDEADESRGTKRPASSEGGEEPEAKKTSNDE